MDIFNLEHKLRPIYIRPNNIGRSIIYGLLTANIRPIILSLSLGDLSNKNTDFNVVWVLLTEPCHISLDLLFANFA